MFKRIFWFVLVNILVMVTISIILAVFGITSGVGINAINVQMLALYSLIWGMTGSFISLLLSRIMAKALMGVRVIDPDTAYGSEAELVRMVHSIAERAGLKVMPEVGIYDSPEVNAFATGPTKNRALVAVSTGLLRRMNRAELEGVIGHEVAHIVNGDMVTMTLIQGIVNAFVLFFSRLIAFALSLGVKEEHRYLVQTLVTIVLQIVFGILGSMATAFFSRLREFRADAGSAELVGRNKMIAALQALQRVYELPEDDRAPSLAAFKISSKKGGFLQLFSTHPPLEDRIQRLREYGMR